MRYDMRGSHANRVRPHPRVLHHPLVLALEERGRDGGGGREKGRTDS